MGSKNKIGFWSLFSLAVSSQLGSGMFSLPSTIARFGSIGILSWLISGVGAIFLVLVFAGLCKRFPKTGGPHAYVYQAFGVRAAFFTAWTYWIISWVSSAAVVIATAGYIGYVFGGLNTYQILLVEIGINALIMIVNLYGVHGPKKLEFILLFFKILTLIILPLIFLSSFNFSYFFPINTSGTTNFEAINGAAMLTFWGFIGLETATAPAELVDQPSKTIPKAIICGTSCVLCIYLLANIAIFGVVPKEVLVNSIAPFADASNVVLGGHWHKIISFAFAIICLSTLNAWVLTSGQIALGAAQDKLFPKFFLHRNKYSAPTWGVLVSSLGIIPLLFFTVDSNLVKQLNLIIDVSVTAFLLVYAICVVSYIKILLAERERSLKNYTVGVIALIFCFWAISGTSKMMVIYSLLVILSGVPIYFKMNLKYLTLSKAR